jgi:thioredoxin-related protein
MKNYIIGVLLVIILSLGSWSYKHYKTPCLTKFPIKISLSTKVANLNEPNLYLFLFFSKDNCSDCLQTIHILNNLPSQFVLTGIVPSRELEQEKKLRKVTGANFKLKSLDRIYKRFNPNYAPTLFGVSEKGKILFVLPSIPHQDQYLETFLLSFYYKSLPILISDGARKKDP